MYAEVGDEERAALMSPAASSDDQLFCDDESSGRDAVAVCTSSQQPQHRRQLQVHVERETVICSLSLQPLSNDDVTRSAPTAS